MKGFFCYVCLSVHSRGEQLISVLNLREMNMGEVGKNEDNHHSINHYDSTLIIFYLFSDYSFLCIVDCPLLYRFDPVNMNKISQ